MRIMIPPSQHATRMVPNAQKEPSKGGHLVMLVDCGFGICRASAASPLTEGEEADRQWASTIECVLRTSGTANWCSILSRLPAVALCEGGTLRGRKIEFFCGLKCT